MLEAGRSKPWPKVLKAITGERELSADAINSYFEPLYQWLMNYRKRHGYAVGWSVDDLSSKVLHRKAGKFESGQGRSGILKTNNKGMSLSINIPSSLTGGKSSATTKNNEVEQKGEDDKITIPLVDLAKLLSSGDHFSMSTSETNANAKDGSTSITNKEFSLDNDDEGGQNQKENKTEKAESNSSGISDQNSTSNATQTDAGKNSNMTSTHTEEKPGNETKIKPGNEATMKPGNETLEKPGNETANNETMPVLEKNNSVNETNGDKLTNNSSVLNDAQNVTSEKNDSGLAKPINQTLAWQGEAVANSTNAALANFTNIIKEENSTAHAENGTARQNSLCMGSKRSPLSENDLNDCSGKTMDTVSVTPGELIQHVLMKKVKHLVQKTLPQANVEKTNTGFTVNFDLNPKDEIPSRTQTVTGKTRQQHVNVFIAPKGVVVKPKASEQLMKPSFVPVQNKDNLELRGGR